MYSSAASSSVAGVFAAFVLVVASSPPLALAAEPRFGTTPLPQRQMGSTQNAMILMGYSRQHTTSYFWQSDPNWWYKFPMISRVRWAGIHLIQGEALTLAPVLNHE